MTIGRTLAVSLVLVTLVPFLPLAALTWRGYSGETARIETEIEEANRRIAELGSAYIDSRIRALRREAVLLAADAAPGAALPDDSEVLWEVIGGDGRAVASQVAAARVGTACEYREALAAAPGTAAVTEVGPWLAGSQPVVLVVARGAAGTGWVVGVLRPEALHRTLAAWSRHTLDRHVYLVDRGGRLVFYSDIALSRRGEDLSANPPIRRHLEGRYGAVRFRSVVSGKQRLGYVEPLPETGWAIVVSADIGARLLDLRERSLALAWAIGFALAAAAAIHLWTSRRLTRPTATIREALRRPRGCPAGTLALDVPASGIAEYDDLVTAFNDLSQRLAAAEAELVQAAKAALTGQIASGIAHEIGTPLNVISGNAQYALRKVSEDDPRRELLHGIVRQSERISEMVKRFLEFARSPEACLGAVDLGELAAGVVALVPGINPRVEVRLTGTLGSPLVQGDPKLLEHALMNLVVNACQAMPDGGTLTLHIGAADDVGGAVEWVSCTVGDTGAGIAPENLPRVFEPFFTTKPLGQGTGLGLAIVDRIVRQHGGDVGVASVPGRGTTFTVRLRPAAAGAAGGGEG